MTDPRDTMRKVLSHSQECITLAERAYWWAQLWCIVAIAQAMIIVLMAFGR